MVVPSSLFRSSDMVVISQPRSTMYWELAQLKDQTSLVLSPSDTQQRQQGNQDNTHHLWLATPLGSECTRPSQVLCRQTMHNASTVPQQTSAFATTMGDKLDSNAQNQKYITLLYSHQRIESRPQVACTENLWSLDMWFLRYMIGQAIPNIQTWRSYTWHTSQRPSNKRLRGRP